MNNSILENGLTQMNISFSNDILKKIDIYINEILLFNSKFDLTNANDKNEITIKHILDSLSIYNLIKFYSPKTIADIGTGVGFPGIPLAIFFPEISFTLIDRSQKRISFLQNSIAMLKMKNVELLCSDILNVNKKFDMILSRALTDVNTKLLQTIYSYLNENASIFFYKGKIEKTKSDMKKISESLETRKIFTHLYPVIVPYLDSERCFLQFSNFKI